MFRTERSLVAAVTRWLVFYMALLSVVVFSLGNALNEHAERMVWKSLLQAEIDHYERRRADDPAYRWHDIEGVALFGADSDRPVPPELGHFKPGLHDEVRFEGRDRVMLVRMVHGSRQVLMLDIGAFEAREFRLSVAMLAVIVLVLAVLGFGIAWALRRLVRPLAGMAADIGRLRPEGGGQRLPVPAGASAEMVVIANAFNDYLARNERFVERERQFVATSSHELRTPLAAIEGAAELALGEGALPDGARQQLMRIGRTAQGMEELIALLLVLARDPGRLAAASEEFRLDRELPAIVENHRHLCAGRELELALGALPPCVLRAPVAIVRAAIGNLLRNAIENSDRGMVMIVLDARAVVAIEDPGHGMAPGEISALYARMARGDGAVTSRVGHGIGLDLIARVCQHLGWSLRIEQRSPRGTRAVLDLGASRSTA